MKYGGDPKSRLNRVEQEIFAHYGITRTLNDDWDLYIPPSYTKIEGLLESLRPRDPLQIIFGISGCDVLVSKRRLYHALRQAYPAHRLWKMIPRTYDLKSATDLARCLRDHDSKQTYILKNRMQRKEGLKLTHDLQDVYAAADTGSYDVAQCYLKNVFTVGGRKLNLRLYLCLVYDQAEGGLQSYLHPLGKCLYTADAYDPESLEFRANITSFEMDTSVYDQLPFDTMDLYKAMSAWGLDYFHLWNDITRILQDTVRACSFNLGTLPHLAGNRQCQLFGVDIILTSELQPLLLELNKGPSMKVQHPRDMALRYAVLRDMYDLVDVIESGAPNFFTRI